jgi:hypothetical protein
MKRIIILFFTAVTVFSAYGQNSLQDGDRCFDDGDYACAVKKYNEAYRLNGQNKQAIEIKLTRAKNCAEWIKSANQEFDSQNYKSAEENYQKVLDSNPKDVYAKTQLEKCNNALNPPATTLSVSKSNLSFSSSGEDERITVTTNASSYSVQALPSWCTVWKYAGYFIVTCSANSGNATRTDYFTVTAGNKEVRINVSQTNKTKTETKITLTVSTQNVSFAAGFDKTIIDVKTNADDYQITYLPSWCRVGDKNSDWFSLICEANNTNRSRSDWFKITAGNKEVRIDISQAGETSTVSTTGRTDIGNNTYRPRKPFCFNCPNTGYKWGFSAGYVEKRMYDYDIGYGYNNLMGLQFGFKIEPLFKYGFGLHTGVFYEFYYKPIEQNYSDYYDTYTVDYMQHVINIPLHLEYRLNFSRYFNLFVYGGPSVDMIISNDFGSSSKHVLLDYGGGLRINHVQFNIGKSCIINNINDSRDFNGLLHNYKDLAASISYMF